MLPFNSISPDYYRSSLKKGNKLNPEQPPKKLLDHVLKIELDETALYAVRPQKPKRLPTVLSKQEAKKAIRNMHGI